MNPNKICQKRCSYANKTQTSSEFKNIKNPFLYIYQRNVRIISINIGGKKFKYIKFVSKIRTPLNAPPKEHSYETKYVYCTQKNIKKDLINLALQGETNFSFKMETFFFSYKRGHFSTHTYKYMYISVFLCEWIIKTVTIMFLCHVVNQHFIIKERILSLFQKEVFYLYLYVWIRSISKTLVHITYYTMKRQDDRQTKKE